jgi:hypothetical protein
VTSIAAGNLEYQASGKVGGADEAGVVAQAAPEPGVRRDALSCAGKVESEVVAGRESGVQSDERDFACRVDLIQDDEAALSERAHDPRVDELDGAVLEWDVLLSYAVLVGFGA